MSLLETDPSAATSGVPDVPPVRSDSPDSNESLPSSPVILALIAQINADFQAAFSFKAAFRLDDELHRLGVDVHTDPRIAKHIRETLQRRTVNYGTSGRFV
jgi:hypothetical protein